MSAEDQEMQRVKDACNVLIEHFDTVQIFVTRYAPEEDCGTVNINYGAGNWFARYGQVCEWLVKQEARTKKGVAREDE